jgi:hypothetical protein
MLIVRDKLNKTPMICAIDGSVARFESRELAQECINVSCEYYSIDPDMFEIIPEMRIVLTNRDV